MILLPKSSPAFPLSPVAHSLLFSLPWLNVSQRFDLMYAFLTENPGFYNQIYVGEVEITFSWNA